MGPEKRSRLTDEEQKEIDDLWRRDTEHFPREFLERVISNGGYPHGFKIGGGLWVSLWLEVREGIVAVRELYVSPVASDSTSVTASSLREIALQDEIRKQLRAHRSLMESIDAETRRRWERDSFSRAALRSVELRPGRRGHTPLFLAQVAQAYLILLRRGSRKPVEDLAMDLGYTTARIRDLLASARSQGLLTPAPKGKAGGSLTSAGWELLEKESQKVDRSKSRRRATGRGKGRRKG